MSSSAAAFAASEAIKAGEWDRHLLQISQAVRDRLMVLDDSRKPSIPLPPGQGWVWLAGAEPPHWEAMGRGAIFP